MSFLRLPTISFFGKDRRKRQYAPQALFMAYEEVTKAGIPIHKAAKKYGIPDSTLRDRFRGPMQPAPDKDVFNTMAAPATTLTLEEEKQLVSHCKYMADIGYGYSRSEFLTLATDFAISLGKKKTSDPTFSQSWYESFKKRHPDITLSKPQKLSMIRAKSTSPEVLDSYFQSLERVFTTHTLHEKPENIWNIDETGLLMEHNPTNVICSKGSAPQAVTSNRGQTVTIIAAGNAVGSRIPPFYVFPGKRWNSDLLDGSCPGAAGTMSETGWSNTVVFLDYMERHFLRFVQSSGSPVLVLIDGHKSHINLTLKEWGEKHHVLFFVIPPHTSHVTQPLDVGCFGPLKRMYYAECQTFMRKNPGIQINRMNVAAISSKAYNKGLTPENLISAFRRSGVFPLERNKITPAKTTPSIIYHNKTDEMTTESEDKEDKTGYEGKEGSFLDKKKITNVQENQKKRKRPQTLQGNMMSPKNRSLLKKPSALEPVFKQKKVSTPSSNDPKELTSTKSPKPGTSGVSRRSDAPGIPVDTDTESSDNIPEDLDESQLCCVCKKFSPDTFKSAYTVEFISWGQCDNCNRWVHLKYCTSVRVVRRGSPFLCPLCEHES